MLDNGSRRRPPNAAPCLAAPRAPRSRGGRRGLLTNADVQSSARYQALPASKRASADRYATDLRARAEAIVASLTPQQKADLLAKYDSAAAVPQGWLTADQAATLVATAGLI